MSITVRVLHRIIISGIGTCVSQMKPIICSFISIRSHTCERGGSNDDDHPRHTRTCIRSSWDTSSHFTTETPRTFSILVLISRIRHLAVIRGWDKLHCHGIPSRSSRRGWRHALPYKYKRSGWMSYHHWYGDECFLLHPLDYCPWERVPFTIVPRWSRIADVDVFLCSWPTATMFVRAPLRSSEVLPVIIIVLLLLLLVSVCPCCPVSSTPI